MIMMKTGKNMCPSGQIFSLDSFSMYGSAVCIYCKQGTYSVNPLAPGSNQLLQIPACLNCPSGGNCIDGGNSVQFSVGSWKILNGMYVLINCAAGYQSINSTPGTSRGVFSHGAQ